MQVHEAIARAVIEERVNAAFTLMGNTNMEFLGALRKCGGPPIYKARIEGAAVTMAEGLARSTGKLGFASVSCGPAVANTANALACAVRSRSPLVLMVGSVGDRNHVHHFNDEGLADLTGAKYIGITSAASALMAVREAFYTARAHSCPVVLDLPRPIGESEFELGYAYTPSSSDLALPRRLSPDAGAAAAALDLIQASERPVIMAGVGAVKSDAREAILALGHEIGALLSTGLFIKNWFHDSPYDLGAAGGFTDGYGRSLFARADLVIAIGSSLDSFTTQGGKLFPRAKVLQIDIEPQPVWIEGRGRCADCYVQGDARDTVEALVVGVRARALGGERFRSSAVRDEIADGKANADTTEFDVEPDRADGRRLINTVDRMFPANALMSVANGHNWGITIPEFKTWRWPQLYASIFGSIGMALPTAVGAAIGNPGRPVLHIEGDGSFMMNLHTVDTVAHYQLPIFSMVMNDAAFGSEAHQLIKHGDDVELAYQHEVDFAAVAASLGYRSAVVRSEADLEKAVEQFLSNPGPYLVDARVSRKVISVQFRRLHYGIDKP